MRRATADPVCRSERAPTLRAAATTVARHEIAFGTSSDATVYQPPVSTGQQVQWGVAEVLHLSVARLRSAVGVSLVGLVCCCALAAGLGFYQLGARPLIDAEASYASIGANMLRSGDWIQPRLNGVRYYEKPPLFYWAVAAANGLLGKGEATARIPAVVAYLGTVLAVYLATLGLCGAGEAIQAALIAATSVGVFYFGRLAMCDGLLVCCLSVSLLGLMRTTQREGSFWSPLLFYLGSACATLTKGFVGLFLPLASAAIYVLTIGDRQTVRRLRPGLGALIMLAVLLPWHVALAIKDPAFLPFYVLNEHVYRFFNVGESIDYVPQSIPSFWVATAFWMMPWTLFLPAALTSAWSERRRFALPLIWAAVVLGFFTLARSRLEKYGLPAIPALAVVVGSYWSGAAVSRAKRLPLLVPGVLLIVLGCVLATATFAPAGDGTWLSMIITRLDGHYREHPADAALFLAQVAVVAQCFSLVLLGFGIATMWAAAARRARLAFVLWVTFSVILLGFVEQASRYVMADRSMRVAAEVIQRHWEPGATIVSAGPYEDVMSLGFYLPEPIALVGWESIVQGTSDLEFGLRHGDAPGLVLSEAELRELWNSPRRVFLIATRRPVPSNATVLLTHPTFVLATNYPQAGGRAVVRRKPWAIYLPVVEGSPRSASWATSGGTDEEAVTMADRIHGLGRPPQPARGVAGSTRKSPPGGLSR